MVAFTIHEMPDPPTERLDRADAHVFVKEGFSWTATLFAPVWLLMGSMWIAFAAYCAVVGLLVAASWQFEVVEQFLPWALVAIHFLIGLEGDSIRRWTLRVAGWRDLGAVTGRTPDECERNFYDAWLPTQPHIAARNPDAPTLGRSVI